MESVIDIETAEYYINWCKFLSSCAGIRTHQLFEVKVLAAKL